MILRAWFDPKIASGDLRQSLIDRQVLGVWPLRKGGNVHQCVEVLRLPDGSIFKVRAYCLETPTEKIGAIQLSSPEDLPLLYVQGSRHVRLTLASGKGGFLALQLWLPDEKPPSVESA